MEKNDYQIALDNIVEAIDMLNRHCEDGTFSNPNWSINKLRELVEKETLRSVATNYYNWHDLRKNPNDLPELGEKVLTTGKNKGMEVQIFRGAHVYERSDGTVDWWWDWKHNSAKTPIAWKRIEPFEDD